MRIVVLILLALTFPGLMFAGKKRQPDPELCQLKTIYVVGNSESASILRREIEKRTWLRLENDQAKADAVLEIAETRSTRNFLLTTEKVTVSGTLTRGGKLLMGWSASFGEGVFNSGAGSAAKMLLFRLNRAAGCGK